MLDGGPLAWHACPTRGGTWLLPSNGSHILQPMLIWLDDFLSISTYPKESRKALEVMVLIDLQVGWGTNWLGMLAPLVGRLGYSLLMVATSFKL